MIRTSMRLRIYFKKTMRLVKIFFVRYRLSLPRVLSKTTNLSIRQGRSIEAELTKEADFHFMQTIVTQSLKIT